jgi:hypothetical protein
MAVSLADIDNFFRAYPRDFHNQCEGTMWQLLDRFGTPEHPRTFDTALLAAKASAIYTKDPAKASYGDFGFWDQRLTPAGHTAFWTPRGWLMGSNKVTAPIGGKSLNVGYVSFADYTKLGFLGFAHTSAGRDVALVAQTPLTKAAAVDWAYVEPTDYATRLRIQKALKERDRYDGDLDGVWAELTRKGIQTTIKGVGYTGKIDGLIARDGCYFIQKYAHDFGGYTGQLDRKLGPNSWAGFALGLERP